MLAICLTRASPSLGSALLSSHVSCWGRARWASPSCCSTQRETLNVLCLIWKACEIFSPYFLSGMNIIELSPFISQTWWQLNSGVVAEMGMRTVQRELEFALQGGRDFSMHLEEERRAVLWGLFLPEILTYLGLGWVRWGGHREQLGMKERRSAAKWNRILFFFLLRNCQGYLEMGLKSFPGSEECLSELLLDNRLSCWVGGKHLHWSWYHRVSQLCHSSAIQRQCRVGLDILCI